MNTLLTDLQEISSSFRCGTCPGGPEEECDDQCEKHRLEYMAEELGKKGYVKVSPLDWKTLSALEVKAYEPKEG